MRLGSPDISQIGWLEAESTAEYEIRDSCIQTVLSGIIVILCVAFVFQDFDEH